MLYSELQTFVQEAVSFNSTETTSKIVGAASTGWINQAYFRLCRDTLCSVSTFSAQALTSGQAEYVTATATGKTDIMRMLNITTSGGGATNHPMRIVSIEELDAYSESSVASGDVTPFIIAFLGLTKFKVFPTPGSSVTISGTYVSRPTALSAGTDIPSAIPEEYHLAIAYKALETALSYEGRLDEAQYWRGLYETERDEIRRDVNLMGGNRKAGMRPSRDVPGRPVTTWDRSIGGG